MNNWNPSFDSVEKVCSPGARGPAYIALPNEHGPSDQTDLNRRETCPDWSPGQGGRPRGEGGRPAPGPARPPVRSHGFWSLLEYRKLAHTLISLCKPDVWAFPPCFLITPCRNRQTPKLVEFYHMKPKFWMLVAYRSSFMISWRLNVSIKDRQQAPPSLPLARPWARMDSRVSAVVSCLKGTHMLKQDLISRLG